MPRRLLTISLLVMALLALLAALWSGLIRIGWTLPSLRPTIPAGHGPLMVAGFLGTLISIERVIALTATGHTRWLYLGPALSGLGGLTLIAGITGATGPLLITLGSVGLVIIFAVILRQHTALYTAVMALGALSWLVGNSLWLAGRPIFQVVWWWAGFLILTIAGERLELSRITRLTRRQQGAFLLIVGLLLTGLITAVFAYDAGVRLTGLALLLLAGWLLRYDIARRTIRRADLTRYVAACLLAGYGWLAGGGALALIYGSQPAGLRYDAILHAIFLGFVFSMIFGHAPIIIPAILQRPYHYHPRIYLPLLLLQPTLLLRVVGDLLPWIPGRRWGGLLNVIVLLLFLALTILAVYQGHRLSQAEKPQTRRPFS